MRRNAIYYITVSIAVIFMTASCGPFRIVLEGDPLAGGATTTETSGGLASQSGPGAKPKPGTKPKPGRPGKNGSTTGTTGSTGTTSGAGSTNGTSGSGSTSGSTYNSTISSGTLTATQETIIATAKAQLGKKYVYGGNGPDSFDCSGLMVYAFKAGGVSIPRNSGAQYSYGKKLSEGEEPLPCDLIFFSGSKISSTVGHVGMVLSYDKSTGVITFIHAATSSGVQIQQSSTDYYAKRFIGVCRVL